MCGISGIISNKNSNTTLDLIKMTKIIDYRGPDDEGFVLINDEKVFVAGGDDTAEASWIEKIPYLPKLNIKDLVSQNSSVSFGHRRLSILDLSANGHQPMCDSSERYWITFNGEIYNYIEIREKLQALGHVFHTNTDTEVILIAYQTWGTSCQDHFNGMWSLAIYDTIDKKIFFSRDRYGIKPFYYWFSPQGDFYFASEIKQFTNAIGWKAILNGARAYDYLYYALTDHTEQTLFKGVYLLRPGQCFHGTIEDLFSKDAKGSIMTTNWYTPIAKNFKGSFTEAKTEFLSKFKDAVQLHLRSDVPIGSALSGGLDSSAIVSYINILLKQQDKSDLQKTFSSCSDDERYDERKWMEIVVAETNVDGHYIYPQGKDVFTLTEHLVWHMDEPYQSQSAFLGYHVFQEARKNNIVVLMNGQGADEYLSGYNDFRLLRRKKLLKKFRIKELYSEVKSFGTIFNLFQDIIFDNLPRKLKYYLANNNKRSKELDSIIDVPKIVKVKKHPYETNDYVKKSHFEISKYQLYKEPLQKYLRWEDRNSMAHSIEARVPFLDHRLVELAHSLPLEYLDAPDQSKRVLVEAMKGILPERIRQRKDKKGFITPEQNWFMNEFKDQYVNMLKSYLPYAKGIIRESQAIKFYEDVQNAVIPFDYTYWRILQFCIWMKVFNVDIETN